MQHVNKTVFYMSHYVRLVTPRSYSTSVIYHGRDFSPVLFQIDCVVWFCDISLRPAESKLQATPLQVNVP